MILTVADSDPETCPREEDVTAFLMRPGDIAVLNKRVWHDANHAVGRAHAVLFSGYGFG